MSKDYTKLSESELQAAVDGLDGWRLEAKKLHKDFEFPNFEAAFGFVAQVALAAQKINHHPDLFNSYNQVKLSLSTHSVGEVTSKDIELAQLIDKL